MKIGKGDWKPCQTGVILTTTSVLSLAEELLDAGHTYLLTGRLTQDCLENLFSVVRLRTFKMILTVEAMFREAEDKLMDEKNVKSVLLERAQELTEDVKFADCHNIKRKLLAKFFTSRLHFFCKKQTGNRKKESSKKFNELGS